MQPNRFGESYFCTVLLATGWTEANGALRDARGFIPRSRSRRMSDVTTSGAAFSVRRTVLQASQDQTEVLHKVAGSVYVASDLIGRAVAQYLAIAASPDRTVVDQCTEVGLALAGVAQTLEAALRADRLGPAA